MMSNKRECAHPWTKAEKLQIRFLQKMLRFRWIIHILCAAIAACAVFYEFKFDWLLLIIAAAVWAAIRFFDERQCAKLFSGGSLSSFSTNGSPKSFLALFFFAAACAIAAFIVITFFSLPSEKLPLWRLYTAVMAAYVSASAETPYKDIEVNIQGE